MPIDLGADTLTLPDGTEVDVRITLGVSVAAVRPPLPPPPPPADPLAAGLVAWYRNNGTDTSGNGNDLTAVGGANTGTGPGIDGTAGAAISMSGLPSGYFGDGVVPGGATSWSVQAWVKRGVAQFGTSAQVEQTDGASNSAPFLIANGAKTLFGKQVAGGPPTHTGASTSALPTGAWHHLVGTYDAATTTAKLYVDGSLANTNAALTASPQSTYVSISGSGPGTVTSPDYAQFIGFWANRVLSADDVTSLYNGGAGYDPTA